MSIYSILQQEIPTIMVVDRFTALDAAGMRDLAKRLHESSWMMKVLSRDVQQRWKDHLGELRATASQRARGLLSPFLSTPLQSDNSEIQRILGEQIQYVADQILPESVHGLIGVTSGRVLCETTGGAALKRAAEAGKRNLRGTIGGGARASREVAERTTFLQGAMNLDVFSRMESQPAVCESVGFPLHRSIQDLRYLRGDLLPGSDRHEAILQAGEGKVEPERVITLVSEAARTGEVDHVSVWQDRLANAELMVRLRSAERGGLKEALGRLLAPRGRSAAASPVAKHIRLYFREIFAEEPEGN